MQYYAKSKEKTLTTKEKERMRNIFRNLKIRLRDELKDWESATLEVARRKLFKPDDISHKTLTEHHNDTVQCAEIFFRQYGQYFTEKEKSLILTACRYHDLGKVNEIFQMIVNPQPGVLISTQIPKQIPHGFLSAVSISKKEFLHENPGLNEVDFQVLVTAIYYHHTREDSFDDKQIREYCEKYYKDNIKSYLGKQDWKIRMLNRTGRLFENDVSSVPRYITDETWNEYQVVKGMLNKFDWTVSAGYAESENQPDIESKRLVKNICSKLNKGLRPVQQYMYNHNHDNLVIIAPTGSGKTEAALLWINGEKGFYTLPLKVSSNAIYKRIKETYSYENVALLHSDSIVGYLEESAENLECDGYEKYERAKLLSAPLTVCTVDQLFKFVYKALGTEIFAATLKYSKLVLDEIQAYSPRIVATLIYGLKTICQLGGRFAIITATFPPVLKDFMESYGLVAQRECQMRDFSSASDLKRHIVTEISGEMDIEEIAYQGRCKKVLVICNTVSKAQEIYEKVSQRTEDAYLLHSRFIRRDRALLENMIMGFSSEKDVAGIWVTTQIVEASLDIDFDILYTEMCTSDSLLQRMGRCNRAGRYLPQKPNIIVYDNGNGIKSIYDKDLYIRSLKYLEKYKNIIFTEAMKIEYIDDVYKTEEIKDTVYYREIENFLEHFDQVRPLDYSKQEADQQFRQIDSIAVIPDSVYNLHQGLLEDVREFLKQPYARKQVKAILKDKLKSLTIGINLYNGRFPVGVDPHPVDGINIYRTELKYEFDNVSCKGRGLLLNHVEDESYFI